MTYASPSRAARASGSYASIGLETEVLGATPERLISLLFRGARTAMSQARLHMTRGDIQARGAALSKAIDIVESGLKASVDMDRGGEVAQHLVAAYDLIVRDLMLANLHHDEARLASAEALLATLAEAWTTAIDPRFTEAPSH